MVDSALFDRREPSNFKRFYVGISLLMIAIAAVGFWPSYFGLITGAALDKEWFIHFHATVYVGWLGLFATQVALVATKRTALHRKIGPYVMGWGVLVLFVGLMTTLLRYQTMLASGPIEEARAWAIWPVLDMVIFAGFFIPAVVYRRRPELHKRFMIVATTNLLVAAVARAIGLDTAFAHTALVVVWTSPIWLAMVYDYVQVRTVHPIYLAGALVITLSTFRDAWATTESWIGFSNWMAALVQ